MNGDLIRREDLIKKIFPYGMPDGGNYGINARAVMEAVMGVAATDAREVVHAHWVKMTPDQRPFFSPNYTHVCSKCGSGGFKHYKRCYECGAIMDEVVFEPTPLWKLPLSTRVRKRLKQMGVLTVEELEAMDKHTLYNTPGLGKKSILEIESELRIWKNEKEKNDVSEYVDGRNSGRIY